MENLRIKGLLISLLTLCIYSCFTKKKLYVRGYEYYNEKCTACHTSIHNNEILLKNIMLIEGNKNKVGYLDQILNDTLHCVNVTNKSKKDYTALISYINQLRQESGVPPQE